jgi:hypothetical protein
MDDSVAWKLATVAEQDRANSSPAENGTDRVRGDASDDVGAEVGKAFG